jgi:hypothetical protein
MGSAAQFVALSIILAIGLLFYLDKKTMLINR